VAVVHAISDLFLKFDASPAHQDCSCAQVGMVAESRECYVEYAVCEYFRPGAQEWGSPNNVLLRGKAWDVNQSSYLGQSKGWSNPIDGFPSNDPGVPSIDALKAMRTAFPARKCNPAIPPAPLIVIPGLISSNINYKLQDSPPPAYAFWCNHTTDGYVPLWPLTQSVTKHPSKLVCWALNVAVQYDPLTKNFTPLRKGLQTELVDFGTFNGIPALQPVESYFEVVGYEMHTTLFAAPFDWRVTSSLRADFSSVLCVLGGMV
jgi:hypothetical protein